ncbi:MULTISPECIES: response regulator transcription factor [unclassified Microbacterium]|uniref:response regulator transcription factor n=1 Tax=unclassified Microbacterium TaxID=2609290 RepID=UPI000CFD744B|nr:MULTISPECIES: response regulator transcription factor [unclassified Microbacterium]PQZ60977.1 DNA-binding response regulator [Microbacterium sp. MYb43]PQZ82186.1 DNA-binding response regulator [Microbacterium sp. MYb40]PRB24113.1 DNA-binding response regulator [Microbacterium sp. MYb54]PRB30944.1 DNA-binding response regulator [Microbacterium sp. MYb50]PRB70634.1 DNA-binding response regulator [Microbacterium sp. MYb24]
MISVLVVDDQPLVRQAVRDILTDGGLRVIGEAASGRTAVASAAGLVPDVVLMDIRMPDLDGIAATELICAARPAGRPRVLILTTFEEDEYVVAALRAGASGFIGKGAEPEDIVRAVRTIDAGEALLSSTATRTLIERSVRGAAAPVSGAHREVLSRLTSREHEVLLLVAGGKTNQEIASSLTISPHTAKTHVNRIMSKADARDRAQLVILAYESGIVVAGG